MLLMLLLLLLMFLYGACEDLEEEKLFGISVVVVKVKSQIDICEIKKCFFPFFYQTKNGQL
jgi:hypothetical protein